MFKFFLFLFALFILASIMSRRPVDECRHLIGFHQHRDGTLSNVYGPCGPDPNPPGCKECG